MLLVAHRTPLTGAACAQLAAIGARVFEADLQIDDHDRVVVSHYLPFGRLLHRDNWRVRWHTGRVRDPRLADVVGRVPDGCLVSLDLKEKAPQRRTRLVAALIDSLPNPSRFRVCGHRADDLEQLRRAGFGTWRTAGDRRELARLLADGPLPDDAVSVRHSLLTPEVIERLHEKVPQIVAWTVNSVERARQLHAMGVDGITTDRAAVLLALSPYAN